MRMKVELLSPDDPAWDAFLRLDKHDFYHLPSYVRLSAELEVAQPCALHVQDGNRRMLLPLILRPVQDELLDAASPYGYSGPLLTGTNDPTFLPDALDAAQKVLARHQIVSLFVRGHPLLGPPLSAHNGIVIEHGRTASIDLTLPVEELWRRTMRGHRNEISRSIRAGHHAFFDEHFEHLSTFAEIYRATMKRLNAKQQYILPDDYFVQLRAALGTRLLLCLVEIGGEIAGGGLFVETCGLVQYHFSGTNPRFIHEHPTKLMLHFVRTWARTQGLRRMHLGGGLGGEEDSLFKFKAGFSTDLHCFRTLRVVCDEHAYSRLVRSTHPHADPQDHSGYFPLYRKPT